MNKFQHSIYGNAERPSSYQGIKLRFRGSDCFLIQAFNSELHKQLKHWWMQNFCKNFTLPQSLNVRFPSEISLGFFGSILVLLMPSMKKDMGLCHSWHRSKWPARPGWAAHGRGDVGSFSAPQCFLLLPPQLCRSRPGSSTSPMSWHSSSRPCSAGCITSDFSKH